MDERVPDTPSRPPGHVAASDAGSRLGPREILALLNALTLGELSRVHGQLGAARSALVSLGQPELEATVARAQESLRAGDVKSFRRALAQATARLGHVK